MTWHQTSSYRRQPNRRSAVGLDATDGFLNNLADPNGDLAREWDHEAGDLLA
jgi:hypothetical protein